MGLERPKALQNVSRRAPRLVHCRPLKGCLDVDVGKTSCKKPKSIALRIDKFNAFLCFRQESRLLGGQNQFDHW